MSDLSARLKAARIDAGFGSATDAARAHGWVVSTYLGYENGDRAPSRTMARRIAAAFHVSLDWLLDGRGAMRHGAARRIPLRGYVGAGGGVDWVDDVIAAEVVDGLALPAADGVEALIVRGDSQYPRFFDGEAILFDPRPIPIEEAVGHYAVVQTLDGRRMIKIVRHNPNGGDLWRLESHNAAPEDNVALLAVWRYIGVLARPDSAKPQGRKK